MKHKKLKIYAVLLLGLGLQSTQAETALFVKQKVGSNTPFNMSTLKSLTFAAGNVLVNKKDATTSSFVRTNVQYMNFAANIGTEVANNTLEKSILSVYFNQSQNVLNIAYSGEITSNLQLEVFCIDGKMALKTKLDNASSSVSVQNLTHGMYLCRVVNGNKTQIQKFIKQ
jgi:hypothetical protein